MLVYYAPVAIDYVGHAIRLRQFRYPLIVNPGMALSGLVGEKKSEIFNRLKPEFYPRTVLVNPRHPMPELSFGFPIVAKPDEGERGMGVAFLRTKNEWRVYHDRAPRNYLVQEFISAPFEVGVLFFRKRGVMSVTSIGIKLRAQVVGDGKSTVEQLARQSPRFDRQMERLTEQAAPIFWSAVPARGEIVVLDEIRNHRRGAEFRDGRHLITEKVATALDRAIPESTGIFYGRADIRCSSEEAFKAGQDLCLVEVNGITGEPAEIYDPEMPFAESIRILRRHWNEIAYLAEDGLESGERPPAWKDVLRELWRWRKREAFFDR